MPSADTAGPWLQRPAEQKLLPFTLNSSPVIQPLAAIMYHCPLQLESGCGTAGVSLGAGRRAPHASRRVVGMWRMLYWCGWGEASCIHVLAQQDCETPQSRFKQERHPDLHQLTAEQRLLIFDRNNRMCRYSDIFRQVIRQNVLLSGWSGPLIMNNKQFTH